MDVAPSQRPDPGPRSAADRSGTALQRKLVLWALALVIVPTLLCTLWLNYIARSSISAHHRQGVLMVTQTLAASLSGRLAEGQWTVEADEALDGLSLDPRFAFVQVLNPDGYVLYSRTSDVPALIAYNRRFRSGDQQSFVVDWPMFLGDRGDLAVHRAAIWDPPLRTGAPRRRAPEGHRLEGFVVLALRDHTMPATLTKLWVMHLTVAAVVCLVSLPVVIWAVRRWVAPLRQLVAEAQRIGALQVPVPVRVKGDDELSALAAAFNQMARNLYAARLKAQRANTTLERKVAMRTAELERVNARLEAEIEEKNEFLRAVSHDLGTPLRNIGGMTAMLLMKYRNQLADDVLNKLERIKANVKVQTEFIQDLLELSRIRTRPGRRDRVDLDALVRDLADSLSYDLERRRITLDIKSPLPVIFAERNRMRQLFQNLLDNAVKYMMDRPTRRIVVSCDERAGDWHFTVSDTGPGIAEQDRESIFLVFRRAKHSGSHRVPGRGVGLATVRSIVETYGGRVWVESELGQGSTFHFTLDRSVVDSEPVVAPAPSRRPE
ncbi:MAG: HAMP domain-containing sensor histidine kinase [Phycisphaeraceae bacterium]